MLVLKSVTVTRELSFGACNLYQLGRLWQSASMKILWNVWLSLEVFYLLIYTLTMCLLQSCWFTVASV